MANILIIEPDYKCKYPPLGLMKISYYHKEIRKDIVWFAKGKLPDKIEGSVVEEVKNNKYYRDKYGENIVEHIENINQIIKENKWDRVYVCTLFTFEYEKTIEAIDYAKKLVGNKNVYTGGILATLMTEKLKRDTGVIVNPGQLTDSIMLGYDDKINIDKLTPDYSILSNIEYQYENENAYYAYTTRGCGMKCGFCAVQTLEPVYEPFISIKHQINEIKEKYGEKKDLLLMDNNVLKSVRLKEIIDEIVELGFGKNATYINPKTGKVNRRYVDFNQGLDAFLLTEEKAKLLGKIAIKPARIAFDHIEDIEVYTEAVKRAARNGVNYLSNYLLYNADEFKGKGKSYQADTPLDLYNRLKLNVDLQEQLNSQIEDQKEKINIFSFPMRYIPLDNQSRGYVGKNWTRKYLRAIQVILTPTQGKGVSSKSFFDAAFGKSEEEFMEVILMPEMYIATRGEPEKNKGINSISDEELQVRKSRYYKYEGLRNEWRRLQELLEDDEKEEFIQIVGENKFTYDVFKRLSNVTMRKLFIHYLSEGKLLQLLEDLYMNEELMFIDQVKEYITCEEPVIYDDLQQFMVGTNKMQKRLEMYNKVFGTEGINELIIKWIQAECEDKNFIVYIKGESEIPSEYLYIIGWIITTHVGKREEIERIIQVVRDNQVKQKTEFLEGLLERVYEKINLEKTETKQLVDKIKAEVSIQLSLLN